MTLVCIGASLILAVVITSALHRLSLMGILISLAIPTIIVPTTWYPFFAVSERLRVAEARIVTSEQRYRSILDDMGEGYVEFDRAGRLTFWNQALGRITEYTDAELGQRGIADFMRPEDLRQLNGAVGAVQAPGRPAGPYECEFLTKAGAHRTLEATFSALPDERGRGSAYRAVIRDVTERATRERERKEYEEQLRRARKMEALGTLAGGVAHDLNNVLAGIVGYPDLLLLDCPKESPHRQSLLAIKESGERAAAIVQDLLTLGRRGVSTSVVLDLNRIVADYLASPDHALLQRSHPGIRVTSDLDPSLLAVEGSPAHISKSVANLVLNAFEAIPGEGTVSLTTADVYLDRPLRGYDRITPGDYVTLTVRDSGTGISPEDLDRVFEPFFTRKAMGRSGSGLGLAVVWATVKDHHGYVDLQSEVRRGTVVTLYFPATRRELPVQPSPPPIEHYLGRGERVLVVDDMADQRQLASRLLERLGYDVRTASSGEEAVAFLRAAPAALVLLDMIMDAGMDGLDTCRAIFALRPDQPVLIASGFSETDRVREALRLGCSAYLRKPYRVETLGRLVHETIARHRMA